MKNYKKIRRIFEQETIDMNQPLEPATSMEPQMPAEMPIDYPAQQLALPAEGQTSAPIDPMSMTVRDFVSKCKEIDPLVCMGIESFITKHHHSFVEPSVPAQEVPQAPAMDQDVSFSNVVDGQTPPAPVQNFSLDQTPETLNFPS